MQSTCTTTRGSGLRGFLARHWPRGPQKRTHGCNPRHRAPCAWASSQALVWRLTSVMPVWTSRTNVRLYLTRRSISPGVVSRTWLVIVIVRSPVQVATARSLPPTDGQRSICVLCPAPCTHRRVSFTVEVMRLVACEWPLRHGGSKWLCSSASRFFGRCELSRAGELLLRTAARERASPAPRLLNFPRARTRRIQAARHNLGLDLGKFDRR